MRLGPTLKVLGIIVIFFSFTMVPPIWINWIYAQDNSHAFYIGFLITFILGIVIYLPNKKTKKELRPKDGFIIVLLIWLVVAICGAIPYMYSNGLKLHFIQALFESMSGYSTTGATVITGLDNLPKSILYYRQQSQFFGGMGIIVLVIAVLPLIGVGGMQLYRAEANGPWKENKLTPRIMATAKALWFIYIMLTLLCILFYKIAGMSWFDSICYAYSTIGTGGFAPHDKSIEFYGTPPIYIVCMVFMVLSATSFALHFLSLKTLNILKYWKDAEFRGFVYFIGSMGIIVSFVLIGTGYYPQHNQALWHGFFQVVSFGTNTGFTSTSDYSSWPLFIPILLAIIGLIGGCAGSTSGGLKIIRAILVRKQAIREMYKLIHPNGVFPIKLGDKVMSESVVNSVWGFIAGYFLVFIIAWLLLMASSVDQITAFSAVAACISNVGPGIGGVSVNYANLPDSAQIILGAVMLIGRLEVFTVLVLFVPDFWRR